MSYYEKNKEKVKQYYQNNKEKKLAYRKNYYEKTKETDKEKIRLSNKLSYEKHKQRKLAYVRAYREYKNEYIIYMPPHNKNYKKIKHLIDNPEQYRYLCYKVDFIFGLREITPYSYKLKKPIIKSYYNRNKERIKKQAHKKYLLRKERIIKEKEQQKRIFLLNKKIDYIFGLKDSWW